MPTHNKQKKIGKRIIFGIIIFCCYILTKNITLNEKITIESGESASKIFKQLSLRERIRIKRYLIRHPNISFSKLEAGNYTFSGTYTPASFIQNILKGAEKNYIRITILEGRSIYDIDEALTKKGYITGGEYIKYVTDYGTISELMQGYEFLRKIPSGISTLEGFLYPDTYNVDRNKDIIKQLVNHQLQTFTTKVRTKAENTADRYKTIILASVLEKEERNIANKPTVAGIFLKRLSLGMKIDADITLCYGLKTSYTKCTPSVIAKNISDKTNIYNTRQQGGIPPTPIANPTRESIEAIINPQSSNYLYYLHDMQGNIHYGKTLEEHNQNKQLYLK